MDIKIYTDETTRENTFKSQTTKHKTQDELKKAVAGFRIDEEVNNIINNIYEDGNLCLCRALLEDYFRGVLK